MNRDAGVPRPFVRPMRGWWRRDPFLARYMLREATAVAVLVYAIVLTVGVVRLSQGEATWNGWLAALRTPWSIVLHVLVIAAMAVHAWSWFVIMPKTLPMIFVGGRRLAGTTITRAGWLATVLTSIALFALARWWQS